MRHRIPKQAFALALVAGLGLSAAASWASSEDQDSGHAAQDAHGDDEAHGDHEAHDPAHEFNWYYGFLGESSEIEHPTAAWRLPGMPVPFAAYLLNTAVLFFILVKFGKAPVVEGLRKRRAEIMAGIEHASKMKAEAAQQLAEYQAKLDGIETEIDRIHRSMRETAKLEQEQILAEAKARKVRMERDAQTLLEQERKAARQELLVEAARGAIGSATQMLSERTTVEDHERLSNEYLDSLDGLLGQVALTSGGQS